MRCRIYNFLLLYLCTQYACIFDLTKRKQTEHWPPNFQSQLNKLMAFLFMHYNSYSHIFYFWSHSLSPSLTHFPACRHKHKQFTCVLIFHEFSQFLWLIVFIWFGCLFYLHLQFRWWQFYSLVVLTPNHLLQETNWFDEWLYAHDNRCIVFVYMLFACCAFSHRICFFNRP